MSKTLRKVGQGAWMMVLATPALAQWNPASSSYAKDDARDVRVMTWNVQDALCRTNPRKQQSTGDWTALARIVAAMKPDVLILQECGDNSGNSSGSGVDSVSQLTTVMQLFVSGGPDPFISNQSVVSYVQLFDPSVELPYIFVSTVSDNFNRNVILSRYPFTDVNGDGFQTVSGYTVLADKYVPTSGNMETRGFQWAEIDLPDEIYAGDLVVGNCHLKSGGTQDDRDERVRVAQRVAYFIDHYFNGAGSGVVDPNGKISLDSPGTSLLDAQTAVVWGGDFNEDENSNGRKGPAEWMVAAEFIGTTDGTDRDQSDASFDDARDFFDNYRTTQSSSKLDYIAWQDAVVTLRRAWIFDSRSIGQAIPPEIGSPGQNVGSLSGQASDHLPVIADFIVPLGEQEPTPPGPFSLLSPVDGSSVSGTIALDWEDSANADEYEVRISTTPDIVSGLQFSQTVVSSSFGIAGGTLAACGTYYWDVIASNADGVASSNETWGFVLPAPGDWDASGGAPNSSDFLAYLNDFAAMDPRADLSPVGGDGLFNSTDFLAFLNLYAQGCN